MDDHQPTGCGLKTLAAVGALCGFFGVFMVVGGLTKDGQQGHRASQVPVGVAMTLVPLVMIGIMLYMVHHDRAPRSMLRWPVIVTILGYLTGVLAPNHLEPAIKAVWKFFGSL